VLKEIDHWIAGPFHRLALLSASLKQVGYGSFRETDCGVEVLALDGSAAPVSEPIKFPPDGSTFPLTSFSGEWPNPISSCPGYSYPTGPAITLQFGSDQVRMVSEASLADDHELDHCVFNTTAYTNHDGFGANAGRRTLRAFGGVVMIPHEPFVAGHIYHVSITADNREYAWSFSVTN
jgi:hypothetical protein